MDERNFLRHRLTSEYGSEMFVPTDKHNWDLMVDGFRGMIPEHLDRRWASLLKGTNMMLMRLVEGPHTGTFLRDREYLEDENILLSRLAPPETRPPLRNSYLYVVSRMNTGNTGGYVSHEGFISSNDAFKPGPVMGNRPYPEHNPNHNRAQKIFGVPDESVYMQDDEIVRDTPVEAAEVASLEYANEALAVMLELGAMAVPNEVQRLRRNSPLLRRPSR